MLDDIKRLGFHYSTVGAITISVSDIVIPEAKKEYIQAAEEKVLEIEKKFKRGFLTNKERKENVIKVWSETTNKVTDSLMDGLSEFNPVYMMANSGARGSTNQIRQLAGMRGLMADPSGEIIEIPIRANFREGLTVLEFFISTHGARKGLADTALRTADSGYLTRRLVDVSQDVIVRELDCLKEGDPVRGVWVDDILEGKEVIEPFIDRIRGRYAAADILDPTTGEVIVHTNEMITFDHCLRIEKAGVKGAHIRSVLTCKTRHGVCAKCYGSDMSSGKTVSIGEAVGIIAAQSIGEPGTQLTMRTFHTGGVAGEDITHGLPRVEELFEARKPKGLAVISEIAGVVSLGDNRKKQEVTVMGEDGVTEIYPIPFGSRLKVKDGDIIEAGDELTEGSINPNDILKIKGAKGVQAYLLKEVQMVYRLQGVEISDKHIEVIIRSMLKKCKIEDAGDTELLPGSLVDIHAFDAENERMLSIGKKPATAKRVLLGITKASLATDSFLSAASFQETTRVLTEAAIKGKTDPLLGLKENVIIGKLIPAGTGMKRYRNIDVIKNILNEDIASSFESKDTSYLDDMLVGDDDFSPDDPEDLTAGL
jgi:DNA-directed RNA polymerase subunit beta'